MSTILLIPPIPVHFPINKRADEVPLLSSIHLTLPFRDSSFSIALIPKPIDEEVIPYKRGIGIEKRGPLMNFICGPSTIKVSCKTDSSNVEATFLCDDYIKRKQRIKLDFLLDPHQIKVKINNNLILSANYKALDVGNIIRFLIIDGEGMALLKAFHRLQLIDIPYRMRKSYTKDSEKDWESGESGDEITEEEWDGMELMEPQVPFIKPLPIGVFVGMRITIKGMMMEGGHTFAINLKASTDHESNIDFHLNVRSKQCAIICNNRSGGSWYKEERWGLKSDEFKASEPFTLEYVVDEEGFIVFHRGRPHEQLSLLLTFRHRLMPLSSIRAIQVMGLIKIHSIMINGREGKNGIEERS